MVEVAGREADPYDLMILDHDPQQANAFELAQRTRTLAGGANAKYILLEQRIGYQAGRNAPGHGFHAAIARPVHQAALRQALLQALGLERMPEVHPEAVLDTAPTPVKQTGAAAPVHAGGRTILLVEDNPASLRLATAQLGRLGFAVETAMNGQQAADAVARGGDRFALVLMDCQMPVVDGFEATRIIRLLEKEKGGRVPVVAMTANAMQGDREACLDAGMDDYISKPVTMAGLQQAIERWVTGTGRLTPLPMVEVEDAAIDQSVLDHIRELQAEGEPDLLTELIDLYAEESEKLMSEMRQAIAGNDLNKARRAAHTLKGSGASLGAVLLAGCCAELEDFLLQGNLEAARMYWTRIEVEYARSRVSLDAQRKNSQPRKLDP
jgi:two-component system, sensor histidine kinase and response regulator